jgi:hypothetical protein
MDESTWRDPPPDRWAGSITMMTDGMEADFGVAEPVFLPFRIAGLAVVLGLMVFLAVAVAVDPAADPADLAVIFGGLAGAALSAWVALHANVLKTQRVGLSSEVLTLAEKRYALRSVRSARVDGSFLVVERADGELRFGPIQGDMGHAEWVAKLIDKEARAFGDPGSEADIAPALRRVHAAAKESP